MGHGSIVHGGTIGRNTLIGMNAVIMDACVIGDECIIGALCFVPGEMVIPNRKVVVGNPAKIVKDVSDKMIAWKTKGTELYQQLPKDCKDALRECEALTRIPAYRPPQDQVFETWKKVNK